MHEKEIVEAILSGDQQAFKTLVDRYQLMVVNTCYGFVHDLNEAEDIAQDIFVQVFESLNKFRFESKLSTWLYRMAVNKSINYCNSSRGKRVTISLDAWKKLEDPSESETPQQELLEAKELREFLHKAIDRLPKSQRTALILSEYEDLSYKEIASVMGQSLSAVESLLFRAKTNLRRSFSVKQYS